MHFGLGLDWRPGGTDSEFKISTRKKEEKEYIQRESDNLLYDEEDVFYQLQEGVHFRHPCIKVDDIKVYDSKNVKYSKLVDYVYTRNGGQSRRWPRAQIKPRDRFFVDNYIGAKARLRSSKSRPIGDNRLLLVKKKAPTH